MLRTAFVLYVKRLSIFLLSSGSNGAARKCILSIIIDRHAAITIENRIYSTVRTPHMPRHLEAFVAVANMQCHLIAPLVSGCRRLRYA